MPEVIFPGPEGRLEGRYHPQKERDAPIAIVLHPHPQFGGTMNHNAHLLIILYAIRMGWILGHSYENGVPYTIANQVREVSSTVKLHRNRLLSMDVEKQM